MARLKDIYNKEIRAKLASELSVKNANAIPKITKIVINAGVGRAVADVKRLEEAQSALEAITGQKSVRTKAKKSIASFKLRTGMPVGAVITLRGDRMYEFLDRLVNAALPRVRDFRGISKDAFDADGNYSLGIKEHTVFPELIGQDVAPISLQININTTAQNKEQAHALLSAFGFPFKS